MRRRHGRARGRHRAGSFPTEGRKGDEESLPYRLAIDRTLEALGARRRAYRTLAAAAAVILTASPLTALLLRLWWPLLGATLLVPLYLAYAVNDAQLLLGWQRFVLALWSQKRVDSGPFRDALRGRPGLPARTLEGMLDLLPAPPPEGATETRSSAARRAISFVALESHALKQTRSLVVGAVRLLTLVCVALAMVLPSPLPLIGLAAVPLLLVAGSARSALGRRRWRTEIATARAAGLEPARLRQGLTSLLAGDPPSWFARQLELSPERLA